MYTILTFLANIYILFNLDILFFLPICPGIILAMLFINACLGFREEYHAKKSLDELSHELESEIPVKRDGQTLSINTKDLVPGDIILLVGGVIVPGDTQVCMPDENTSFCFISFK